VLLAITTLCALPAPATSQTTDPIFRSWRWTEDVTSARAFGLGGAMAGLGDDGAAAAFNPAGLATLPRAGELQIGLRLRSTADLASGDRLQTRTKATSPATLALRLGPRVALSYQFLALRSATQIDLNGATDTGSLTSTINGPGLGFAVRVASYVSLGVSVHALRLYLDDASYTHEAPGSPEVLARFNSRGETRLTTTAGALVKARELSYGVAVRFGSTWHGLRTASDPSRRAVIDEGTEFDVRSPTVVSTGVAWQPELRRAQTLLLTSQVDRVLLGQIHPTAAVGIPFPATDYAASSEWQFRAGGELTLPVLERWASHGAGRPNRFQVRAGWDSQPSGAIAYDGTDDGQRALFPSGERHRLVSVGMSLGSATIWRVSAAYRFGDGQAVVGLAIRYPGLFP
jgi:hypothetical protein